MRPIAIISCDQHPDYLACLPLVCRSWELQGFDVELAITGEWGELTKLVQQYLTKGRVNMYPDSGSINSTMNKALYTQCIRLYIPAFIDPERYCILGDADMFIGSSFLYRDFDKINVFGWDLTGY